VGCACPPGENLDRSQGSEGERERKRGVGRREGKERTCVEEVREEEETTSRKGDLATGDDWVMAAGLLTGGGRTQQKRGVGEGGNDQWGVVLRQAEANRCGTEGEGRRRDAITQSQRATDEQGSSVAGR
jgi:hypothetical protein